MPWYRTFDSRIFLSYWNGFTDVIDGHFYAEDQFSLAYGSESGCYVYPKRYSYAGRGWCNKYKSKTTAMQYLAAYKRRCA